MLPHFVYNFEKGPREVEEIDRPVKEGNCRLAIQLYFYLQHDFFIKPENILCPKSYKKTGKFILKEGEIGDDFNKKLKIGDVLFAQRIKNKNKSAVNKKKSDFISRDDWIMALHSAIYIKDGIVWHASSIERETCFWSLDKFLDYYKLIAVKRFLMQ